MTSSPAHSRAHSAPDGRPPETVDRLMVGVCGAIWLVWLVVAVISTVALINLGSGGPGAEENSPWLLYTVIAVSAMTIAGAIPLLLRARRDALAATTRDEPAPPAPPARAVPPGEAPTEKIRVFGTAVDPAGARPLPGPELPGPQTTGSKTSVVQVLSARAEAAERPWLRGTASILSAMGLGWISVAVAAYLFAEGSDTAAYVALGAAAAASVGIVAALVVFSRLLADAIR